MSSYFLAPGFLQVTQFVPGGNTVANGGQLFFYQSGSSTKANVYKDNAGNTAWSNPLVLDSGGALPSGGEIWFTSGVTYKAVFAPSTDTDPPASPYWTRDNLSGINDVSSAESEWLSGPAPSFVGATQFSLVGDQTATFTVGRRLKTTNTAGTIYSTITVSAFTTQTTVTVVSDSGTLDSGLSAVSYALLDPANPSISSSEINRKGANVASAGNGTTNIWGTIGDYAHVTGTNSIYSFSTASYAGAMRDLVFDGALTLFSSSALTIPGNANISTAANDRATVRADTVSTHIITNYMRAIAKPLGLQPTRTVFTSPGTTGTYSTPVGAVRLFVRCVGGGGGGSGASTGTGGTNTSSVFGSLVARGGAGGQPAGNGGAGGTGSGGDINIAGGNGDGYTPNSAAGNNPRGGSGGSSFFGGGGNGGTGGAGGLDAPANSGAGGGGGGGNSGANSGSGGGAGAYVEQMIVSPSSSYAYSVASTAAGGSGGFSNGGKGASGIIVIDEYYV